jgi:hypothetical protein
MLRIIRMSGQPKNLLVEANRLRKAMANKASAALKAATNIPGRARPAYPTMAQVNRQVNSTCKKIWDGVKYVMSCANGNKKTQGGRTHKKRSKARRTRKH